MESVSLYSETRNEYLKQLSSWITPNIVEFFRNEYSGIVARVGNKRAMAVFQEFCAGVPKWNQDIIESNTNTILENCRCDYIDDLMTAVFIAHTKMLTAIRVNSKQKKLQITLPKLDHFIHRIFVECARAFWKAPFLFSEELTPIERQKNILQLESMATEALSGAIRSLLPVKSILRDYMNDEDSSSSSEDERSAAKKSKHAVKSAASDSESSDDDENDALLKDIQQLSKETPTKVDAETDDIPFSSIQQQQQQLQSNAMQRAAPVLEALKEGADHADIEKHTPVTIQKVESPPEAHAVQESLHAVDAAEIKSNSVILQKDPEIPTPVTAASAPAPAPAPVNTNPNPPQLVIDTEPSVHFTPYDTVFDENQSEISEIRYAPKISVEDKPPSNWGMSFDDDDEDVPKLSISSNAESLAAEEIVDLDTPVGVGVGVGGAAPATIQPDDIDEPLTASGDFEEIA